VIDISGKVWYRYRRLGGGSTFGITEGDTAVKRIQLGDAFTSALAGWAKTRKRDKGTNRNRKRYGLSTLFGSIVLAVAVLAPSTSRATLITYDGFNYTPFGPLSISGQNGGTDWTTYWGQFFNAPTSYIITNGSLADPSGLLYTYSNCVYTAGGFAGRFFATPANWAAPGATYYFSVLIKPANTPATNHFYGLQIFSNGGNTGVGYDLFVGKNGSGPNWGLEYSSNSISGNTTNTVYVDAYSGVPATSNQTAFLVVRVDFNFGTPDVFSLYVNPTPGGSEPATPAAVLTNDIGTQDGLAMNTGNGGAAFFDEIRLGATFASVTPTTSTTDPNLLTWEPFAYQEGFSPGILDGQPTDGTQKSNGWDNVTWGQFLGGATSYLIGTNSLADPSGNLVTSGNYTYTTNGFAGRYNVYTGLPGLTNATPTYYSILIRPDNLGPTNGVAYLQIFGQPNGNDLLAGKLSGSTFWGLQSGTNLGQAFSTVQAVSNQTTFLVVRGNYVQGGASTFLLYVNPTPGAPEPATPNATVSFNIETQNGLAFNTENGAAASFDEIRVGTNYADVTPAVTVATNTNAFNITSISVVGSNVVLAWKTTGGNTNVVQATPGSNGSYNTNGFVNISNQILIPGSGGVTTNYVDVGGATNKPARYYRIQKLGQ
jgi:hypothetical protein